jgi:hypothetical protein
MNRDLTLYIYIPTNKSFGFQRRFLKGKSETRIVHCDHIMLFLPNQDEIGYFVNRGPHKHHSCKLFGSKGWVVSEKKIKM